MARASKTGTPRRVPWMWMRVPDIYFAVFGAMTKGSMLEADSFDDLTGARIMTAAGFKAVFIAATMSPPGIQPPLELR
jgi:hypothetical protein